MTDLAAATATHDRHVARAVDALAATDTSVTLEKWNPPSDGDRMRVATGVRMLYPHDLRENEHGFNVISCIGTQVLAVLGGDDDVNYVLDLGALKAAASPSAPSPHLPPQSRAHFSDRPAWLGVPPFRSRALTVNRGLHDGTPGCLIHQGATRDYGYTPPPAATEGLPKLPRKAITEHLATAGMTVVDAWLSIPVFARQEGEFSHSQRMEILDKAYSLTTPDTPTVTSWLVVVAQRPREQR